MLSNWLCSQMFYGVPLDNYIVQTHHIKAIKDDSRINIDFNGILKNHTGWRAIE